MRSCEVTGLYCKIMTPSQVIQTVQLFTMKNNHTNKSYLKIRLFSQKQTLLKSCKSSASPRRGAAGRGERGAQRLAGVSGEAAAPGGPAAGAARRNQRQNLPRCPTRAPHPPANTGTRVPGLLLCLAFFLFLKCKRV